MVCRVDWAEQGAGARRGCRDLGRDSRHYHSVLL
jgi:hypothetical protein